MEFSLINTLAPSSIARACRAAYMTLSANRGLVFEMTRRDLKSQYAGQIIGNWWVVAHPLFMMSLYVFVFAYVFKVKLGGTVDMPLSYTAYILSGLVPWLSFNQCMARAPVVLPGHANLVKQVVFPLEVLPATAVLLNLIPLAVGLVVLLVHVIWTNGLPPATYLLLPLLVTLQMIAMLGVSFALAALGPFARDTKDIVQIFALAGNYLMPIFYLPEWVPNALRPLLYLNPFSYLTWCYQDALYFGRFEHPIAWVANTVGSFLVLAWGYSIFRRLRPFFGSAL